MNRKQRRARDRQLKKTNSKSSKLEKSLGLFELLPDDCMICHAKFDKKNREMVSTWQVTVREKQKIVRVYCPTCWGKAKSLLEELGIADEKERENKKTCI